MCEYREYIDVNKYINFDERFLDGKAIGFKLQYAIFNQSTNEFYYLTSNIETHNPGLGWPDVAALYPHYDHKNGVGFNVDFDHTPKSYINIQENKHYSNPLPFRARTLFYYGNLENRKYNRSYSYPPLKQFNIKDYDIIVETRIQCLECNRIDSIKQWLCKDGGGDFTCSSFHYYNCNCEKLKMVMFLRNYGHYLPYDAHLDSILHGKLPLIIKLPNQIKAKCEVRVASSNSNNNLLPLVFISGILGAAVGGFLGGADIALLPSIAASGSSSLMGVNLVAGAAGSALNTYLSNGNIGVNISLDSSGGLKINDIKDTVINYTVGTAFYYLNTLNKDDYRAQISEKINYFTDVSNRSVKEYEKERIDKIWRNRGNVDL